MQAYIPLGLAELGQSLRQTQAVLDVAARGISRDHPESDKDLTLEAFPELRVRRGAFTNTDTADVPFTAIVSQDGRKTMARSRSHRPSESAYW